MPVSGHPDGTPEDLSMPQLGTSFDDSLPHRFLSEIESAVGGDYTTISFPTRSIIAIAADRHSQYKLTTLIESKQNGSEIAKFIADFVEDVSDAQQIRADKAEGWIELIDRSLLAISAAAIVPSLVLLVNQAGGAGMRWAPVVLMAGGVIGLLISAATRFAIRERVNRMKNSILKLKRLSERLRRR